MTKGRLEAFSDGVIAILITILVLELRAPHAPTLAALATQWPIFFCYVLSFIYIAIYWNNHHHLMQAVQHVNGRILWANMHLLFWLSLVPFVTGWMGENHFAAEPVSLYGGVLFMAACAYYILTRALLRIHDKNSTLAHALGRDGKGKISIVIYLIAILSTMYCSWVACTLYAVVALIWLIPDRRFEKVLTSH